MDCQKHENYTAKSILIRSHKDNVNSFFELVGKVTVNSVMPYKELASSTLLDCIKVFNPSTGS
jgi:hypothetical protein